MGPAPRPDADIGSAARPSRRSPRPLLIRATRSRATPHPSGPGRPAHRQGPAEAPSSPARDEALANARSARSRGPGQQGGAHVSWMLARTDAPAARSRQTPRSAMSVASVPERPWRSGDGQGCSWRCSSCDPGPARSDTATRHRRDATGRSADERRTPAVRDSAGVICSSRARPGPVARAQRASALRASSAGWRRDAQASSAAAAASAHRSARIRPRASSSPRWHAARRSFPHPARQASTPLAEATARLWSGRCVMSSWPGRRARRSSPGRAGSLTPCGLDSLTRPMSRSTAARTTTPSGDPAHRSSRGAPAAGKVLIGAGRSHRPPQTGQLQPVRSSERPDDSTPASQSRRGVGDHRSGHDARACPDAVAGRQRQQRPAISHAARGGGRRGQRLRVRACRTLDDGPSPRGDGRQRGVVPAERREQARDRRVGVDCIAGRSLAPRPGRAECVLRPSGSDQDLGREARGRCVARRIRMASSARVARHVAEPEPQGVSIVQARTEVGCSLAILQPAPGRERRPLRETAIRSPRQAPSPRGQRPGSRRPRPAPR